MERAKQMFETDDLISYVEKTFAKSKEFYRMLATGIDRPLQAV